MPLFDYTGQLPSGAVFQGTLEAADATEAESLLTRMGIRFNTLRATGRTPFVTPLSLDEFTFFNEQLSALTTAGLPLEAGLRQLAADVGSRRLKRLLLDLAADLAAGTPLDEALRRQRGRFPAPYPGLVAAGLKTGDLGGTLYGLTTHLRLKSETRRALIEIAAYPAVVLLLTLMLTSLIMRTVVPRLTAELWQMEAEFQFANPVGGAARWFLHTLGEHWPAIEILLLALLVLGIALVVLVGLPAPAPWRERLVRALPGLGQVYWSGILARFVHTSAIAAYSGTPLPELVRASAAACGSPRMSAAAGAVAERLERGERLEDAAGAVGTLPGLWTAAVTAAGSRGDLPAVLAELARAYEARARDWALALRTLLGPLLFLFVAVVVGGLITCLMVSVQSFVYVMQSVLSMV